MILNLNKIEEMTTISESYFKTLKTIFFCNMKCKPSMFFIFQYRLIYKTKHSEIHLRSIWNKIDAEMIPTMPPLKLVRPASLESNFLFLT